MAIWKNFRDIRREKSPKISITNVRRKSKLFDFSKLTTYPKNTNLNSADLFFLLKKLFLH